MTFSITRLHSAAVIGYADICNSAALYFKSDLVRSCVNRIFHYLLNNGCRTFDNLAYNISVKKRGDDITFLRRIVRGGADGSYGIEVAKLAGVPNAVVNRAKDILKELEEKGAVTVIRTVEKSDDDMQISFASNEGNEIVEELKTIDINTLTPIEALQKLYELKNRADRL